ncbi:cytochrome c oxidase assembly protein COX16-domain-containing protein [Catenaria anguillulae PL171]|uniref:Cytochrome c oxidase assembly protein COX16, mitochondrial n=1 Tax=Catenaria anguillulae PL171 TaxID=765915 RepID=A0A1Y2HA74_9FUNG|nr:cytochrome c oxidase assembly protein COX16-domain-containing protein [Catenaria anguillulae PL171]
MSDSLPRASRSIGGSNGLSSAIRRRPFVLFGLPLLAILVGGSFALSHLTETKVEYNSSKLSKEEKLALEGKKRKKFDIREEYFRLHASDKKLDLDDWDMVPIQKPPDTFVPPSPGEMQQLLLDASTKVDPNAAKEKKKEIVRW